MLQSLPCLNRRHVVSEMHRDVLIVLNEWFKVTEDEPNPRGLGFTWCPVLLKLIQNDRKIPSEQCDFPTMHRSDDLQPAPHCSVVFTIVGKGVELVIWQRKVYTVDICSCTFGIIKGLKVILVPLNPFCRRTSSHQPFENL